MSAFGVIIIGSGFGGAVTAARLGQHLSSSGQGQHKVLLLDKGNDLSGRFDPSSNGGPINAEGNRFQHSLQPNYLNEIGEIFSDRGPGLGATGPTMNVLAGKGLGGGSLLYDGVSLRAPAVIFEQARRSRRLWPSAYSRSTLAPYYLRVEAELKVHRMAWTDEHVPHWQLTTKRDYVFAEGCRAIGASAAPLKIADDQDANEGWWNQGQRFAGRQDLSKNYLELARQSSVEFRTGHVVERIVPTGSGYVVIGVDRRGGQQVPFEYECRALVVAAGAISSTALLMRSQDDFVGDRVLDVGHETRGRAVLGKHLSGNGDYGVSGIVGPDVLPVEGHKGKPMSSFCPSFWPEHKFIIIPFYAAPLYLALGQVSSVNRPEFPQATGRSSTDIAPGDGDHPERHWGREYKDLLRQFGDRMLTMGCLALDEGEGEISVDDDDVQVRWQHTATSTEARWSTAVEKMQSIYQALGGEMYLDPYRRNGTVNTSHPLGGCRMAEEATEGIVDPHGECFTNPNLFVVDGAIVPSSLGVNPSLTIAAVAERICERLIAGDGTRSLAERLA